MKSTIKRWLFAGIALSLAALTASHCEREMEIEGSLSGPGSDEPSLPPSRGDNTIADPLSHPSGANRPTGARLHSSATTVTFSGTVVRSGPRLVLREVAGVVYPLDGTPNAWSFEGANVRVTGKIDLATRLLHVDAIEPAVL